MSEIAATIARNLADVRERMARAAARAGRDPAGVRLVAVTKYVDAAAARLLFEAGCLDLGESRPQQLWAKAAALADLPIRWHLIGPLQRNKIARTMPLVSLLHAGESLRLLESIEESEGEGSLPARASVLLEVNVSGDAEKHGFSPDEIEPCFLRLAALRRVRVCGLMGMSGLHSDAAAARAEFAQLRQLQQRLAACAPPELSFTELSMGMSGDFEIAIEEGATLVRVGSALFEGLL